MKVLTENRSVESNGMVAQKDFTIKAGAHIMAVLSGLYKNPVDAMVREYLTNMYDAYLALNREHPGSSVTLPVLSLPSSLSSELVFSDFGIGMSKDTVWNVYAQYGNSTKTNSNDEVGGFGLGSKTAFCYNGGAAWTIESRHGGEKHVFMACVGANGIPQLSHVQSTPTKEHTGVSIRIPIRRQDMPEVTKAARKYVPYFPMGVTVEGDTIEPLTHVVKGTTWAIRKSGGYNSGTRVIMGNVPYIVDTAQVKLYTLVKGGSSYDRSSFFENNRVDLYVPIGGVDIVPSRDDMKYTDRTIAAIMSAAKTMVKELPDALTGVLASCKTEWDAMAAMKSYNEIANFSSLGITLKWNGVEIDPALGIVRKVNALQALDKSALISYYGITNSDRATVDEITDVKEISMRSDDRTFVIIDDMVKGSIRTVKTFLHKTLVNKSHSGKAMRYGHKVGQAIVMKTSLSPSKIAEFFGGMPVTMVSLASTHSGLAVPTTIRQLGKDTLYRWGTSERWEARVNIPTGTKFYYVPLTKGMYDQRFLYSTGKDITCSLFRLATDLGIVKKDEILYGIKSSEITKFDATLFFNLETAIAEHIVKTMNARIDDFYIFASTAVVPFTKFYNALNRCGVKSASPLIEDFMKNFDRELTIKENTEIRSCNAMMERFVTIRDIVNTAKSKTKATVKVYDFQSAHTTIAAKYPLLALITKMDADYYNSVDAIIKYKAEIVKYVKSV